MKKLFSGKFLFILASSLVVLVLLTVGAFYLFNDEDDVFLKSGYVLNPLSSTTEKYFFDENVGYKENLSSMVEFIDVDDKTVSVLKDSFLHYLDDSLSFLKRGAILDLSSVSGSKAVSFYNITSESIIEKKDTNYVISSKNGDIVLKDFIGRISDNKYIVVGDLSLKMAGNDTAVKGEYFEIVYVEEGIVNIENKDIKYQVAAEGTLIYVGNNKIIDLGDKKITVDGKDLMSITAITIDGNENIEIVPKEEEETEEPDGNDGQDNVPNVPNNPQPDNTTPGGDGTGTEDGGNQEEPGDNVEKPEEEEKEEVIISLKNKKIGSTDIRVVFEILNAREDDVYKLQVVNLNTGRTVDMVAQVLTDVEIVVNLLTPNTKYLFSVIKEEDNGKYFQEVIETSGFGIKMEKSYATSDSLAYKVMIDKDADIRNAKLTLYKFNEETGQNEIVTDSFVDSTTGEVTKKEKIISLASLKSTIAEEQEVVFDGLDSDTIYTAVLDEFSVASSNFKDIYNITITAMTLKKVPKFSDMTITKDVGAGSFDLSLGNITDPDNAIVGYTYVIYDKLENKRAIDPIYQSNASPITVKVGDDANELKNDTNYYYNVIIEYFDNEKYIEYVTTDSIIFLMGNEPYITVVANKDKITHESIGATIYLTDNSCLISMPGRKKCSGNSTAVVEVSEVNQLTGYRNPIFTELVTFEVTEEDIKYDLYLDGLKPGTSYNIEVRASYNTSDVLDKVEIAHTDESVRTIETKELSSFNVEWTYHQGSTDMVIYAGTQFKAPENSGTLTPEESLEIIDKVTINLYQGSSTANLDRQFPIATKDLIKSNVFNFKEKFYDNAYPVTTSPSGTFQLTMEDLKSLPGADGKLGEYFILSINAYTSSGYEIKLINNVYLYRVSSILLMDDIKDPVIKIDGISNKAAGNIFENLNNDGTYVGFNISAAFDREQLVVNNIIPKNIRFYVYDKLTKEKVQFYIKDENEQLQLTDVVVGELGENNYYDAQIYMDYGSTYETVDEIMRRGNDYFIGYEVECVADRQSYFYPENKNADVPVEYGLYEKTTAQRETPSIKMYPATSDANSITYGYTISDPDNAIYKEPESESYGMYYQINSGNIIKQDLEMLKDTAVNEFEGKVKIDNLKKGDLYKLHYKVNLLRAGDPSDILTYFDGSHAAGDRMFDGYFDAKNNVSNYNFKYSVINNPLKDNKVTIKINAKEEILDRIVAYKLNFTDSKGNTLEREMWKLSPCANDNENDTPRCLSVDYTELKAKGMKSEGTEINNITVKVTALYDNGLTGYDFTVGNNEDDDYQYCIMQDNSSGLGMGSYISFSSSGAQVTVWTDELNAPKGYYHYAFASSTVVRYWGRHTTKITPNNISVNLTGSGYSSKNGYLNPKMISVDEMEVSGTNTFYFNSITPKVSVKQKAALINGTALNLSLSGVDLADIKKEDGEYYVYVETWLSKTFSYDLNYTIRPVVKVKIDSSNPINTISAIIDGLQENTTHYFRIFTYMRNGNNYVYTELFDASVSSGYVASVYDFKTAKAADVFFNHSVSYTSSEEIYGNRILNTKMNLLAYANNIAFNFDIIYMFCEVDSEIPCGIGEGESHIFKQTIPVSKIGTSVSDSLDISQYDLEYGKNYYMYIYAHADYYQDGVLTKRDIVLNRNSISVKLNVLREPTFVVTRNAGVNDNDGYYIDFDVVVNDPDRTLVDGKYFVKLLDTDGNLVGSMKLSDGNGGYYDISNYGEYGFDAFVVRKSMRITGLNPNAKYTFVVYNNAYLNNYSEDTLPGKEHRTYEVSRTYTVYSANDYGVAFGDAITYGATEKSIIVTFLGGSNFDNVVEVNYTVGLWNAEDDSNTVSGTFVIGENGKYFELYSGSEDWRFVIDPVGMKNTLGKSYEVTISVKVKVPGTKDKYMVLTSADIPGFEGKAVYVEDDK